MDFDLVERGVFGLGRSCSEDRAAEFCELGAGIVERQEQIPHSVALSARTLVFRPCPQRVVTRAGVNTVNRVYLAGLLWGAFDPAPGRRPTSSSRS